MPYPYGMTLTLVERTWDPTYGEETRTVNVEVCPHCSALVYPPLDVHTDAMHPEADRA